MTPGNFAQFLPKLTSYGVQYILIGGGAAIAHGLARATYDVDIVYERSRENIERLVSALGDLGLYYRGVPPGLPFRWDVQTIESGLNFTLTSEWGDLDLFGEVAGGGTYEGLLEDSFEIDLHGSKIRVVSLARLIRLKRAAGRPKDFETIAELEALKEESDITED